MSTDKPALLQVAAKAAIVSPNGKVLILREASTGENNTKVGYWGLVGGRLEPGEAFVDGLKREVLEETGLEIQIGRPLYLGEWRPVVRGNTHQIIAVFMYCKTTVEQVKLSSEHDKYAWINPRERLKFKMMKPDCFVVDELTQQGLLSSYHEQLDTS